MASKQSRLVNAVGLAQSQYPWRLATPTLLTGTAAVSAVGAYAHEVAVPADSTARITRWVDPTNSLAFKAFGVGADDSTIAWRIWGIREILGSDKSLHPNDRGSVDVVEYLCDHLADFAAELSTAVVNASSKIITPTMLGNLTGRWADTLGVTDDSLNPPGARQLGDVGNSPAVLLLDFTGYCGYIAEVDLGTATAAGLLHAEV